MTVLCERFDAAFAVTRPHRLVFEIQVETPQAILGADGAATIARCVHAARGRLTGLHFGTYDYTASLGIAPRYQSMEHPAADYARAVMQVASAGTGLQLSDGSTNVLPVGSRLRPPPAARGAGRRRPERTSAGPRPGRVPPPRPRQRRRPRARAPQRHGPDRRHTPPRCPPRPPPQPRSAMTETPLESARLG